MPFNVRRGDPITVALLQKLYEGESRGIRATGSIGARQTPDGQIQVWGSNSTLKTAVTSGVITARSGTTPGKGNVNPARFNGTTFVVTTDTYTVYSISSTTGGIPSGIYVQIMQDEGGVWWIVSVDCGN